jgi:hypothetical protein
MASRPCHLFYFFLFFFRFLGLVVCKNLFFCWDGAGFVPRDLVFPAWTFLFLSEVLFLGREGREGAFALLVDFR